MRRLMWIWMLGCNPQPVTGAACGDDSDCGGALFCEAGICKCQDDGGCSEGERCNSFQLCQDAGPCTANRDCPAGTLCDSAAHPARCIPEATCGSGAQCPFDQYCAVGAASAPGVCTPGCKSTGDCRLGSVCRQGQCVAGGCSQCPTDPAPDSSYCPYGETCTAMGSCEASPVARELCQNCTDTNLCSNRDLACIVDPESCSCIDGRCYPTGAPCGSSAECRNCQASYCAETCRDGSDCSNGYDECGKLIIPCGICGPGNPCANGGECLQTSESEVGLCSCNGASDCAPPTGVCDTLFETCLWGCASDVDCAVFGARCNSAWGVCDIACSRDDHCLCANGHCYGTGLPCSSGADCSLNYVQGDLGGGRTYGLCETTVGVCGKEPGVTCEELRTEAADCSR
jgi:hypothetical protein